MITDKILIFFPNKIDINTGGPSGFLAHNLLDKPREFFVLLTDLVNPNRIRHILSQNIGKKIKGNNYNYIEFLYKASGAKNYKYLFFHDCLSFERCKHLISSNQVVILQSHSPELPSEEAVAHGCTQSEIDLLKNAEKNSFERADYVIFPDPGCLGLYEELNLDQSKVRYILSGCKDYKDLRDYPLDKEKINLLYIGRRNQIKGFDIVLDSFIEAAKQRDDIQLIIAGGGNQVHEKNVFDIGFINNPQQWYHNTDYVINANRKSYFDLSVLETLSAGGRLIMADNFGHQYFTDKTEDIICFDSSEPSSLVKILASNVVKKQPKSSIANRQLFENQFTDQKYYERFVDFFKSIK